MITRKDIAKELAKQDFVKLNYKESRAIVDWVFDYIKDQVYKCRIVNIRGFLRLWIDVAPPTNVFDVQLQKRRTKPAYWKQYARYSREFITKVREKPLYEGE